MNTARPAVYLLIVALFVSGLAYSAVLPVLPMILREWGLAPQAVTWHTGMLTGVYMLMVFVFAPLWGRISDRFGRQPIIVTGLIGTTMALMLFLLFHSLVAAYVARSLAGLFIAAVIPVGTAAVSDLGNAASRAHRFAQLASASLLGFLVGPALNGWSGGSPYLAIIVAAVVSALTALALVLWVRIDVPPDGSAKQPLEASSESLLRRFAPALLVLVVMFALASFEVAITLRGQQRLGWSPSQIGLLFTECSAVMIFVQGLLFSLLLKHVPGDWLIGLGLTAMILGLGLMPITTNYNALLGLVVLVSAGASIVAPMITYWASLGAGLALGAALGAQTAASSLGQALGSSAVALTFGFSAAAPFWIAAFLLVTGAALLAITRRQLRELKQI